MDIEEGFHLNTSMNILEDIFSLSMHQYYIYHFFRPDDPMGYDIQRLTGAE